MTTEETIEILMKEIELAEKENREKDYWCLITKLNSISAADF